MIYMNRPSLTRFAWLSIAAAVLTIALKTAAYFITGSVGLLSDAVESIVNLVGRHHGPGDADGGRAAGRQGPTPTATARRNIFPAGSRAGLILVAALGIGVAAVPRLITPRPLDAVGLGLAVSVWPR